MKRLIIIVLMVSLIVSGAYAEPSTWASDSVTELKATGYIEASFFDDYQKDITRKEFIYLAVRAYEVLNNEEITGYESITFTDTDDIYARKAAKVGITSGIGNGEFGVDQLLTREQLAVFMVKVLDLSNIDIDKGSHKFADEEDFSSWAVDAIKKAKANGIISGVGDNRFNSKGNATKEVAMIILNNILKTYEKEEVVHPEDQEEYEPSGLEVCYDLRIEDFDSGDIHITMKIIGNTSNTLDLREFGRQHGPQGHIKDLKAFDKDGNELKITDKGIWYRGWGTTGQQFIVDSKNLDEVIITYSVNKQKNLSDMAGYTSYEGYLGHGYGVFTAEQAIGLFLFKDGDHYVNENIHLTVDVPSGHKVITPWYEENGVYYPNHNFYDKYHEKHGVRTSDNFMLSTFAVGKFDEYSKQLQGTLTKVALPSEWEEDKKEKVSKNIFELVNYYNDLYGKSVLDQYLMVYTPQIDGVNSIWAGESVSSQGTNADHDNYKLDMVAHQLFHRWNAFVLGWYVDDIEVKSFFKEGSNRYYEGKSMIELYDKLSYLSDHEINYLEDIYKTYKEKYEKNEIIAMKDARDGDVDENLAWNAYQTGALVWFKLDMKLYEDTNGSFTTNHVMKALDDYARNDGKHITYSMLLDILKEGTGNNYKSFLDQYIYDNKHLDLDNYFEDDDLDKIPNYIEIIRGTDPKVKETHTIIDLFTQTLHGVDVSNVEFHSVGSRQACDYINSLYSTKVSITQAFGGGDWTNRLNDFRGQDKGYLIYVDGRYTGLPQDIRDKISLDEYNDIKSGNTEVLSLDDGTLVFFIKQ